MPTAASHPARRRALQPAFDLAALQVADGVVPFVVLGVADRAGIIRLEAHGAPDLFPDGRRIGTDAVCLLASITKAIVATAVLQQVEAGRIDLGTPLGTWAPEAVNPSWAPITAWHVLTHTTGVDDVDLEAMLRHGASRDDLLRHVAQQGQDTPPGSTFRYVSFTFDVLAEAMSRVLDEPFEALLARHLLEPLGMADTRFDPRPNAAICDRMAPIMVGSWGGPPTAEDPALLAAYTDLHLHGGGLWSSAPDLLRFGRMLLRGGELDGVRVLSPAFVALMTREVTAPRGTTSGLGAATDPQAASHYAIGWGKPGVHGIGSDAAFGHGGISGTRLWIDPQWDLAYVYLSGRWGLPLAPIDAVEHAIYAGLSSAG